MPAVKNQYAPFFLTNGFTRKMTSCQRRRPLQVGALLKSICTDIRNPASFSSPHGLYKAANKINPNITFRDVEFWLETQLVYTLY